MATTDKDTDRSTASTAATPAERNQAVAERGDQYDPDRRPSPERHRQLAIARGLSPDEADEVMKEWFWVHSNRLDDRVVLYEPDIRHPGGQAFCGPQPEYVYPTPEVRRKLQSGELIRVPEPDPTSPRYPWQGGTSEAVVRPTLPGNRTLLGRPLDPDLYSREQRQQVAEDNRNVTEIPVDPDVQRPQPAEVERPA